jgi:transcriptional regulator with XRE-family HTH domain
MPPLLGDKLRALRRQHGFTQVELAGRLSLASYTHITKLEASQRAASLDLILRIAQLFGVTTDYLLRDSLSVESPADSKIAPIIDEEALPRLFGIKLRSLRQRQRLSQTELERQLGIVSRTHINNLEAGRKIPSPELAVQIADLFGVTTDYLLCDAIPVESIANADLES